MVESNFRFHPPYLTAMDFVINQSYQQKKDEISPISLFLQTNVSREPGTYDANVELIVKINYDNNGIRETDAPFWINVSYCSRFSWDNSVPEEMVDSLLQVNAPSVLLSYIRPLVAQITSSSPFPTYNIPFLNLTKMRKDALNTDKKE